MPDASIITRQKLTSVIRASNLAGKNYSSSKPHSTLGTLQFKNARPGQIVVKSNNITAAIDSSQFNSLDFSNQSNFTQLNTLLLNSSPGVVSITNSSLVSYYNSLTPSPGIPAGTTIYALAGTNISSSLLSSLSGKYVLIPETGITIGGVAVTRSGNNLIVGGQSFPIGSQISINGVFVDYLISGSPTIVVPLSIYDLDPINFDFLTDFGASLYVFFKDQLSDTQINNLGPSPNMPKVYPSPALSFSNVSLEYGIALKFTPTTINKLNSIVLTKPTSSYLEIRFKVNLPCVIIWAQIVTRDNLTTNHFFDLSAISGNAAAGTSSYQNIGINDTPPYVYGFYPKLYDLVDNTDYYLVMRIKSANSAVQSQLKMEALYFYFAS